MVFENVSFNDEWVRSQSFKQFAEHEKHHGLTDKQLKEVYDLITKKPEKEKEKED